MLTPDPHRTKLRAERELPIVAKSRTDNAEPNRAKFLTDNEELNANEDKIEMPLPSRISPMMLAEEPQRM
jgi:hypothetical protein